MDGNLVRAARIAVGGVATRPWRAYTAEQSLVGQLFTAATAQKAGDLAFEDARTGDQNLFRVQLGANTVAEALKIARARV
jgi:xanthine dehydrogenase YagS FAD-binding subunit